MIAKTSEYTGIIKALEEREAELWEKCRQLDWAVNRSIGDQQKRYRKQYFWVLRAHGKCMAEILLLHRNKIFEEARDE